MVRIARKIPHLRSTRVCGDNDTPLSEDEQLIAKAYEVMGVTQQEVRLWEVYRSVHKKLEQYHMDIAQLKKKAHDLHLRFDKWMESRRSLEEQGDITPHDDDFESFVFQ